MPCCRKRRWRVRTVSGWVSRLLRPLLGRPIGEQHQGPDDLVAPLGLIHEAQLQLCKLRGRFHRHPFHPLCSRGAYVAYRIEAVI